MSHGWAGVDAPKAFSRFITPTQSARTSTKRFPTMVCLAETENRAARLLSGEILQQGSGSFPEWKPDYLMVFLPTGCCFFFLFCLPNVSHSLNLHLRIQLQAKKASLASPRITVNANVQLQSQLKRLLLLLQSGGKEEVTTGHSPRVSPAAPRQLYLY